MANVENLVRSVRLTTRMTAGGREGWGFNFFFNRYYYHSSVLLYYSL